MREGPPADRAVPASRRTFSRGEVYCALRRRFGLREFRPGQAEVLRAILRGRHALAVLPTGAGKSLCYQLPAVLLEGTTLVISPLIALMEDQVQALRARGIGAACLHSKQDASARATAMRELAAGRLDLLYVAPERLVSGGFRERLAGVRVPFVAVDEAHCVYQWGHDFRPAYLEIRDFVSALAPSRYAAFTATATPEVRRQVTEALGLREPEVVVRGFHRENLRLEVRRCRNEKERRALLLAALGEQQGGGVVLAYARTRRQAEETAEFLRGKGLRARHYHGGGEADERDEAQGAFLDGDLDVLVATSAFGMGIDKADLRLVVHLSLPLSFEDWYQELGRAGRDGEPARNLVLWCGQDYRTADWLLRQGAEVETADPAAAAAFREAALRRLNRVHEAFRSSVCLWRRILDYFGDPAAAGLGTGCGNCTPCLEPGRTPEAVAGPEADFLRRVLEGCLRIGRRYGRRKVAAILAGSQARDVPRDHPEHGTLARESVTRITAAVDALLDAGYLRLVGDEYPVVAPTPKGRDAAGGGEPLVVRWQGGGNPAAVPGTRPASGPEPVAAGSLEEAPDADLLERLRAWRRAEARKRGVPAYVVFPDRTLLFLAAVRPRRKSDLLLAPGIGPKKLELYGDAVLRLLAEV